MTLIDVTMRIVHTLFAGVWAGWTVFMAALVVPAARDGKLGADGIRWMTQQFTRFSSLSSVVLLLTGGFMAGDLYTTETLTGSSRGHLVLTMVVLWLALSGLSHMAGSRLKKNLDAGAKQAAAGATTLFYVAGVVALGLLVVAGWL
ncbi:CopD family protein [Haladaptatus sp. T7]|uniref:CopD family protein n=1 Tax=Haladaptatus sp. T7 TaxID=2029368 RepID=UPI0021A25829|nr:CopD family protein [Haladaptatus sp. T7]GKZ15972.1 hypothetical protein HAL_38530 [Haladaptatus sp. T7]